jgi:hypothetical protein
MSSSDNPLIDTQRADFPAGDGHAPKSIHEQDRQLEPRDDRPSSMRRPGERSPFEEILRWLTRSFAILALQQCRPFVCRRYAVVDSPADPDRQGRASHLGAAQQCSALGASALARWFFLHRVASDTPAGAVRIAQTADAGGSVPLMGGRAADAGQQSRR